MSLCWRIVRNFISPNYCWGRGHLLEGSVTEGWSCKPCNISFLTTPGKWVIVSWHAGLITLEPILSTFVLQSRSFEKSWVILVLHYSLWVSKSESRTHSKTFGMFRSHHCVCCGSERRGVLSAGCPFFFSRSGPQMLESQPVLPQTSSGRTRTLGALVKMWKSSWEILRERYMAFYQ